MKFNWSDDVKTKTISNSIVLIIAISFYLLAGKLSSVFSFIGDFIDVFTPFIIGFAIAYILSRPVNAVEACFNRFLFKKHKNQKKLNRGFSIAFVIIAVLAILSLIISLIIPELIESLVSLAKNADGYIKSVNDFLGNFADRHGIDKHSFSEFWGSSQELFKRVAQYAANALPELLDFSVSVGFGISNFFVGFVLSLYMLSNKELFVAQVKKIIYAIFPKRATDETLSTFRFVHETFGKYFSGQILDSIILGIICFILMSIFRMEYALLICLIIVISNLIPFIGPIVGTVPSFFILLMVSPIKALWFLVMFLVVQQFDANVMQPRIVGKTIGLSSFWVILSVVIGGGLFGIVGVFLAVPAFSVLYAFTKRFVERRLRTKNLSPKTKDYF